MNLNVGNIIDKPDNPDNSEVAPKSTKLPYVKDRLIQLTGTLDPTIFKAISNGLCSDEVASIIIKEYGDPKEYRKIFSEINENNLQINENSWKLFSLSHKKISKRAFNPNIYIKCLLERAIENENNDIDNKFYDSLSDFVSLLEMSPQREEKQGLRGGNYFKIFKRFFY